MVDPLCLANSLEDEPAGSHPLMIGAEEGVDGCLFGRKSKGENRSERGDADAMHRLSGTGVPSDFENQRRNGRRGSWSFRFVSKVIMYSWKDL